MSTDQMNCGLCAEPGRFVLDRRLRPREAPEGWALADIAAIGLCGPSYRVFEGKHPFLAYPCAIGHESPGHRAGGIRGVHVWSDAIASETIPLEALPERFSGLVEGRHHLIKVLLTP